MKGRSLLALSILSLALACEGAQQTTGPGAPVDGSKIIQDGAHGGNKDFFFLPPMVPLPLHNPDFQLGKFNNTLRPSLRVDICQLDGLHLHPTLGVPTDQTKCITGPLKKQFPAGTVQLVNLPLRQNGWWNLFGLPADGFYYVLWDTRQSNLDVTKFYRISVFVQGKDDALGVADVDPMANLRQWKYSLTGEVIQLVDDVMLPITFRVEQGALCATGTTCTSASYTNTTPLTLPYDPDLTGSTAGVTIPAGALPTPQNSPSFCAENPCPTTVTVKITKVNTDGVGQSPSTLCHSDIPQLQQFKGCYEFTTIPELGRLNELGDQFMTNVLVAVCYELEGTTDPRKNFAQLYQSGPEEPSKFLDDVHEGVLIGGDTQDCTPTVIGSRSSNPLIQFASSGWRAVKGGLGKVFGVKTAYAIDLGLGGLTKGFSRISPVLRVGLQAVSPIEVTLGQGQHSANVSAQIVAQHFHTLTAPGVNTVPVTFTVTGVNGTLTPAHTEDVPIIGSVPINTTTQLGTAGIAEVVWTLPDQPGTYTMTATGPAIGGPLTFTRTVPPPVLQKFMLSMQTGASYQLAATPPDVVSTWVSSNPTEVSVNGNGLVTAIAGGEDVDGLNGGNVTSLLTSGLPGPTWRVNTVFDIFPRTTTLVWAAVPGAATYDIVIEFGNNCTGFARCTLWSAHSNAQTTALAYTFGFVGAQPGRWHIISRDANGTIIPGSFDIEGVPIADSPSPWVYFRYNI
jgi:hypothetical protein